jgi:hypothetical protein
MTDEPSAPYIQAIMEKFIARDVGDAKKPLKVSYDFFDVDAIVFHFDEQIQALRPFFTSNSKAAKKYRDNLFMVAPFYHR